MTFREDMYSLFYISLVKPQYKLYCDLVAKTGEEMPYDYDIQILTPGKTESDDIIIRGTGRRTWTQKVASYCCCRKPILNEDGELA